MHRACGGRYKKSCSVSDGDGICDYTGSMEDGTFASQECEPFIDSSVGDYDTWTAFIDNYSNIGHYDFWEEFQDSNEGAMQGVYRVRRFRILGWRRSKSTETIYQENGVRMKLDPTTVFFSPRLSYERRRVALSLKPRERVMVFFAGVGPFALVGAKHCPSCEFVGIELNEQAVKYFEYNVRLNKLNNVKVVWGDVREKAEEYVGWADRVIMPLPRSSHTFVEEAVKVLKPKGLIHFYTFKDKAEDVNQVFERVFDERFSLVFWRKVRDYSPREEQVVMDVLYSSPLTKVFK